MSDHFIVLYSRIPKNWFGPGRPYANCSPRRRVTLARPFCYLCSIGFTLSLFPWRIFHPSFLTDFSVLLMFPIFPLIFGKNIFLIFFSCFFSIMPVFRIHIKLISLYLCFSSSCLFFCLIIIDVVF